MTRAGEEARVIVAVHALVDVHRELELTGGRAEDAGRVVASEGAVASEETE